MNIGISGASGKLGQSVLRELAARARGQNVIAISRTPERAGSGVEGRVGDYDQPDTLAQAALSTCRRVDKVIAGGATMPVHISPRGQLQSHRARN